MDGGMQGKGKRREGALMAPAAKGRERMVGKRDGREMKGYTCINAKLRVGRMMKREYLSRFLLTS